MASSHHDLRCSQERSAPTNPAQISLIRGADRIHWAPPIDANGPRLGI